MATTLVNSPSADSDTNTGTLTKNGVFTAAAALNDSLIVIAHNNDKKGANVPTSTGLSFTSRTDRSGVAIYNDINLSQAKAISDTVTQTWAQNTGKSVALIKVDGIFTFTTGEVTGTTGNSASPSINLTAAAGRSAVGAVSSQNASAITTPSGWTELYNIAVGTYRFAAHKIDNVSAGTLTYNPGCTSGADYQIAMQLFTPPAGGTSDTVGSASGTNVSSGAGQSTAASPASASGTGTASAAGRSTAASAASASGTGAAAATGAANTAAAGSASGAASVSGVSNALISLVATAAGTSSASAVGASQAAGAGSASGAGAASATSAGGTTVSVVGTASGAGTGSGVGASTAAAQATAAGTATVSGVVVALAPRAGAASGTGTASATGKALFSTVGTATGTGTSSAVGRSNAASVAVSEGVGVAVGGGESTAQTSGSASGVVAANATSARLGARRATLGRPRAAGMSRPHQASTPRLGQANAGRQQQQPAIRTAVKSGRR